MRLLAVSAFALAVAGCTSFRPTYTGGEPRSGETVLVGQFDLLPPLRPDEQTKDGNVISPYEFKNTLYLAIDDYPRVIEGEPGHSDFDGGIQATFGAPFFVRVDSKPLYILLGAVYLNIGQITEAAYLPGGMRVDIQAGDRAVYMGTIRYYRNEFFEVYRVELVDESARAQADFTTRFGSGVTLERRLAVVPGG